MKVDEVVFLLGEPDDIIKGEVFDHWSWVDLRDDEGVVDVTIEILHGVVSSISIQGMSTS
jgi:hypothetical protein